MRAHDSPDVRRICEEIRNAGIRGWGDDDGRDACPSDGDSSGPPDLVPDDIHAADHVLPAIDVAELPSDVDVDMIQT